VCPSGGVCYNGPVHRLLPPPIYDECLLLTEEANVSNKLMRGLLAAVLGVVVLLPPAVTFGWGSNQHGPLANMVMNDPSIAPFLTTFGLSQSAIASAAYEPPNASTYQWVGWPNALNSGRNHNGYMLDPNFVALDENTRLGYMLHNCCDCGVPVSHAPANEVWTDQGLFGAENELEIWNQQPLPTSMPSRYTGTYAQSLSQFHTDQISLATRYQANHSSSDYGWAAAEGYRNALRLSQTVLRDYFLLKMPEVAHANGTYTVHAGGVLNLSSAGSYDPDGDAFSAISWDLDNNGTYDVSGANPSISYVNLVNTYHLHPGTAYTMKLKVVDDNTADAGVYQGGFDTTTLTLAAPLGGDANYDGLVNFTDLNTVLTTYNQSGKSWANGDFNGDGTVNFTDLNVVLTNYNRSGGGPPVDQILAAHGIMIPEPASLLLVLTGLFCVAIRMWRRAYGKAGEALLRACPLDRVRYDSVLA
jgi:hypothetical protein